MLPGASNADSFDKDVLWLKTASGRHQITIEVAKTLAQKSQGLMFRTSLAPAHGMLFPYETSENHAMWMRNTYISLDMVFITEEGRVHRIEKETEPHSERVIYAGAPVKGVLELAAGEAARLDLKAGDVVEHGWFGTGPEK